MEGPLDHPLNIAVPASYNDQQEGVNFRDHYGFVFYQRELEVPKVLQEQRLVLRFGAVTHGAQVYLNGHRVAQHQGGFLPFEVEITEVLRPGKNRLTVSVDNRVSQKTLPVGSDSGGNMLGGLLPEIPGIQLPPQNYPNFDFFNYAGITRPVKLYTTPRDYIEDVTLVSRVEGNRAVVSYRVDTMGQGEVRLLIRDEEGKEVAQAVGDKGEFVISPVHLWQPLAGYLYTARVEFGEDCYEQTFGVRTVEVRGIEFLINGKPFYFKGFGRHEDSPFHGRGIDEVLHVKDLSLLCWLGANSFRTSHYPHAEEMMELCDREGIVVIDETPAVGVHANFGAMATGTPQDTFSVLQVKEPHEEVIRDMIARDKNHPCVVLWSLANESDTTTFPEKSVAYYKPLYDLAKALDPEKRPVTIVGVQNEYQKDLTLPLMDVICLNRYYGWYLYGGNFDAAKQASKMELDYWSTLGKPVMLTEYGADTVAGLHLATPTMFTEEYQVEFYAAVHEVVDQYPGFVGEQLWNFADFATIQGIMRVDGNKKGIFTRDRRPKMAAHALRERWRKIPNFYYKSSKAVKKEKLDE
ncbi:beta-glucuronidase [Proteiniclasticum sediminis]|uniref:beta-glucuronidase n=1 Tax=Proteiniclasticum sediminis TaxID=2804028 RepID=UPI0038B4F44B